MNILITSAGRRVSLVKAFKNEAKKIGNDIQVMTTDARPQLSAACQIADQHFQVPRLDHKDYLKKLLNLCKQQEIGMVVPTIDTELKQLAHVQSEFLSEGIQLVISSEDFVDKCRDKRKIHKFFEAKGIGVAKEFSKDNYELPLFIKPLDGSRSVDNFIINSKADLTDYHFLNDKLMFLEYLDHNDYEEYTCDMYYSKEGQLKCVVPRMRLEVRDGEVNKGITKKNKLIEHIRQKMGSIPGAKGCLTCQFFMHKSNHVIYGIEINPRFGGGYPLSYLAGANFPLWLMQEYLIEATVKEQFDCWEENLLMLRYDDEILVRGFKG